MYGLMLLMGLRQEHNRPDRDEHITVLWDNIKEEGIDNFEKRSDGNINTKYDICSIMHYRQDDRALKGRDGRRLNSWVPKPMYNLNDLTCLREKDNKLTATDIEKINKYYRNECRARGLYCKSPNTSFSQSQFIYLLISLSIERQRKNCDPANNDNKCCHHVKCGLGEGDCDRDTDCAANLVCGRDNCRAGDRSMDCCESKTCFVSFRK